MARRKRTSASLEKAELRFSSLSSINPDLDLGNGLRLADYRIKIEDLRTQLDQYNTMLSTLDGFLNNVTTAEKELNDFSTRMLTAIAAIYGKDSTEYEMAGGTRSSEIKRNRRSDSTETDPESPPDPE